MCIMSTTCEFSRGGLRTFMQKHPGLVATWPVQSLHGSLRQPNYGPWHQDRQFWWNDSFRAHVPVAPCPIGNVQGRLVCREKAIPGMVSLRKGIANCRERGPKYPRMDNSWLQFPPNRPLIDVPLRGICVTSKLRTFRGND